MSQVSHPSTRSGVLATLFSGGALLLTTTGCVQQGQLLADNEIEAAVFSSAEDAAEQHRAYNAEGDLAMADALAGSVPVASDLWERVSSGFLLWEDQTAPHYKRVDKWRNWYAKNPNKLKSASKRATPYLHYIAEEVKRRGLPQELALIPMIESAYDPYAFSWARAAGLWQIMPRTGEYMGLRQDWWYDGRRDVIEATNAALNYFEYLHGFFDGDWMKAIAAYNAGEGTVLKAVKANQAAGLPTDYWSLTKLRQETKDYVPKLLAVSQLIYERHVFDTELHPVADAPYFVQVDLPGQMDLSQLAALSSVKLSALQRINPGYNQWSTTPEGPHRLLVPIAAATKLQQRLAELSSDEYVRWKKHTVRSGDSLQRIAQRYDTTAEAVAFANALNGDNLRVGQHLLIPKGRKDMLAYAFTPEQRALRQQAKREITHTVAAGDSLWKVASAYNVSVQQIADWNRLNRNQALQPGQRLIIKSGSAPKALSTMRRVSYRVRRGDTLESIARRYNVTVDSIRARNKLGASQKVRAGKVLRIELDVTLQTAKL